MVRHLRYFLVVAEELHVGQAADRIGIAQPALSQRIRRLERELDARLFDRTSQGVLLTPAGEVLRAEAHALLDRFDRVRAEVARAARGEVGTLRVGVPPQLSGRALAAVLDAVARARPDLALELPEVSSAALGRMLVQGELAAALVHLPFTVDGVVVGPAAAIPLGVVLPRGSALAERTELALADLRGQGLVLVPREAAPGLYDATLEACRSHGFDPARVRHASNPELVLALVLAGEGVAFDSGGVARKEARVVWRPLTGPGLAWRMALAWPAGRAHPAVPALAEVVVDARRDAPGHALEVGHGGGPGRPPGPEPRGGTGSPAPDDEGEAARRGPWAVVNPGLHAGGRPRAGLPDR